MSRTLLGTLLGAERTGLRGQVDGGLLVAVVPARVRARWDAMAASQLASEVSRLSQENDALYERVFMAEHQADCWRENAMELAGDDAGLTIDGSIVRLGDFHGRPYAEACGGRCDRDGAFAAQLALTALVGPIFKVAGTRVQLADLLRDNDHDEELEAWARTAFLGERFPGRGEPCERVS